jgi:uncharacterized glyoxalase superfamily protein PhnB
VVIFVYVANVDGTLEMGIANGAELPIPARDQFWGDRTARFMDPAGRVWTLLRIAETGSQKRSDRWSDMLKGRNNREA